MKMLKRAIAACLLLATPALGQYFEPGGRMDGDLNDDYFVDFSDLTELLAHFGTRCVY